jgi:hypothetical protein
MKMIKLRKYLAATALSVAAMIGAPAHAFDFQGVTWTYTIIDSDSVQLTITNAVSGGTGNWADITHLWSISFNPTGTITGATITPPGTFSGNELTAFGCSGGTSGKACFTFDPFLALTDNMVFTIDFVGTGIDLTQDIGTKVAFLCSPTTTSPVTTGPVKQRTKSCGSLMSQDIPTSTSTSTSTTTSTTTTSTSGDVPEPGTLTLLGLGLVGFGYMRRFRKAA